MDDFIFMLILLVVALAVIFWFRSRQNASSAAAAEQKAAAHAEKTQMAQDIKSTKTSSIEDAVSILNDLAGTQSTYRHYCELVGTSMRSGGVKAPYSQREVAYYSVRCYRIENVNGRDYETLVAQEASVDPFYFTDSSGDTRIYVNLESFGPNVILLNSANHIEGPSSDFSKAFKAQSSSGSRIGSAVTSCMGLAAEKAGNLLAGGRDVLDSLRGVATSLRDSFTRLPRRSPAFAGIGLGIASDRSLESFLSAPATRSNVVFAASGHFSGGRSYGQRPSGQRPSGTGPRPQPGGRSSQGNRPSQPQRGASGRTQQGNLNDLFDGGLGTFLGSGGGFYSGMPSAWGSPYGRRTTSTSGADLGGVLLGMGLSALLDSVSSSLSTSQPSGGYAPQDTFRGYRIVEDIVPLDSPIYCIGEIYKAGEQVYMGASVAADYTTSFFATKAETEVLASLAVK